MIAFNNQRKEKEISQLKNTKPKILECEIQFNPVGGPGPEDCTDHISKS